MNYIFDFDGTIVDSLEAFITVFNKNMRGDNDPLSAEEIQKLRGMSSRRALRHIGIKWWHLPKLVLEGIPEFRALLPQLKPFEGLSKVLEQLEARGDKLYIVTSNTKGSVDTFLNQYQLMGYFTYISTGAGVFNKSRYIRRLITKEGLKRHETVYVGDETRDISAARMSRLKIVSVTWGFNTAKILRRRRPNFLINNVNELLDINLK